MADAVAEMPLEHAGWLVRSAHFVKEGLLASSHAKTKQKPERRAHALSEPVHAYGPAARRVPHRTIRRPAAGKARRLLGLLA